jgi:thiazole synthase
MSMKYFECDGMQLSSIWHCFGNYMHKVDLDQVLKMLAASRSNVIPVNTHLLDRSKSRDHLLIGFGDVTFDVLSAALDMSQYYIFANINHQTTAASAVEKVKLCSDLAGFSIVKLEVLSDDLKTSNDAALINAVAVLREQRPDLCIMPLHSNDPIVAKELASAGCPLLRVMGGPIGSGVGLPDEDAFAQCCSINVPIVLDGGVGSVEHYSRASQLGAAGCLVNSMLFETAREPYEVLEEFVQNALRETSAVNDTKGSETRDSAPSTYVA